MQQDFWNTRQPYRPFPQLWAAFAEETGMLDGKPFEVLFEASRVLASHGSVEARRVLEAAAIARKAA